MKKLILFDIDGTLVLTGGAGARAMALAFRDVFGLKDGAELISMAGRTDAWIVSQVALQQGIAFTDEILERCHRLYIGYLLEEIEKPGPRKGVLPGVRDLLDALAADPRAHVALLTGNFERGAQIKLQYFDLWKYFATGAFGDVARDRNSLLSAALQRVATAGGPVVVPADITVVGDTPLDVAVAVAGGVRSLAVATGGYDVDALRATGADVVLPDLGDVRAALAAVGLMTGPV